MAANGGERGSDEAENGAGVKSRKTVSDPVKLVSETIVSEVVTAWDRAEAGDFWPLEILDFKAGDRTGLARMVRWYGLKPNSEAANFVGDVLEGKFKATKHDKHLQREYEILVRVYYYDLWRRWAKANPSKIDRGKLSLADSSMLTMQDVYLRVAEELKMTVRGVVDGIAAAETVEQTVKRNRERRRTQS
jgi:hypothetical protein